MLNRKSWVVLMVTVALFALSCNSEFTREECLDAFPDLALTDLSTDQPIPGPIVDLEPDGDVFNWRLNAGAADEEVLEASAGPVFDENPAKRCLLRKDFIGYRTSTFSFFTKPDGAELQYPAIIHLENDDGSFKLDIIFGGRREGLEWWATQTIDNARQRCKLKKGPITDGKVPNEFGALKVVSLKELYNPDKDGKNIELRVEY